MGDKKFRGMLAHLNKTTPGPDEYLIILADTKRWLSVPQANALRKAVTFRDKHALLLVECALLWRTIERWNVSPDHLSAFTAVHEYPDLMTSFVAPW